MQAWVLKAYGLYAEKHRTNVFSLTGVKMRPHGGLTDGFGIGRGVSPRKQMAIGTARGPDLATIMLLHFDVSIYVLV